jgi:hypothetical protein
MYQQVRKGLHVETMQHSGTPAVTQLVKRLGHQYIKWTKIGTDLAAALQYNTVTLCSYSTSLSLPQTVK